MNDLKYAQWLKARPVVSTVMKNISYRVSKKHHRYIVLTCASNSDHASLTISSSMSTSDALGDVLRLPQRLSQRLQRETKPSKLFVSLMKI